MSRWGWLPRPIKEKVPARKELGISLVGQHGNNPRGSSHYAAKLTESDVRNIRSGFYKSDVSAAKDLGIHAQTVRRIRRREMWAHVQ